MKKVSLFLFVFMVALCVKGYSQTTTPPTDFFAGKWEITVVGLPDGDTKFVTDLVRKDGKLTGELKDPTGKKTEATPISKIEEEPGKKLTLYMDTTQAGEVPIELAKTDDDHLKGQLMNMFDATAVRIKK
ncbi:hypothetical protein [Spirosoma endophyticum]|uniref:Lipocalin-like domain-containing protein n=1 Tax=Spirosoma endophyticum TaxID=662367 RepID=A0A1I2GW02_9BACT|nr:hypothetical protein [Spirosoma endophyticum]SFF20761.1 hypothetical protein SAMN05216167_13523 [Spirosoma endophyticum]